MRRPILLVAFALMLAAIIWLIPVPGLRFWSSFGLLWVLPGLAWIPLLTQIGLSSREEKIIVALGLNFVVTPIIALTIVYFPGQLNRETLILAMLAAISLPLIVSALYRRRQDAVQGESGFDEAQNALPQPWWETGWIWLLVIIAIAAAIRLVNLGYSEFQGDEAAVLVRSARIITGEDAVLFQHKKGPVELLLTIAGWSLTGITNEWMARLPFAWASLLGVAGIFLYGRRQSNLFTAIAAAGLLAVEGYLVGFGRIVQYQSVVFLLSTLALLCLLIYAQQGKGGFIILASAFFALGTWAHYDAILFLPAGLLLIAFRLKYDWQQWRQILPVIALSGILGLLLMGLFYVPFFRSSQAEGTLFYVTGRIGTDQAFYNHLLSTLNRGFVYDSVYLLLLIFGSLAVQILFTWQRWGRGAVVIAVGLLLAVTTSLFYPDWWEIGESSSAWVVMAVLLFGALLAPQQDIGTRAIWLWLGIPAMFYLYFVALPLTHVYTAVPGAALLAALGLYNLGRWLAGRSQAAVRVAAGFAVILFILGISYTLIMFVNHSPEYLRKYPESKHILFWTPYGEELPREGLFGFPYRAGWKTVGYLMDSGEINGSYDSNEERDVTDYYTRQAMRFDCATPDNYVTAVNVQDEVAVRFDQIEADYTPSAVVAIQGRPKITIHQRHFSGQARTLAAEDYEQLYDLGTTPEAVAEANPAMVGDIPTGYIPLDAQIGDFAQLSGYQIDTTHARPGGFVELLLLWQALGPAAIDYQVFTHLHDGQEMRGQLDGQPICDSAPTSRWQAGSFIVDPYRIPIHPEAASGSVPLTVGMYDLATLQRLPVTLAGEALVSDAIVLTDVQIRENE